MLYSVGSWLHPWGVNAVVLMGETEAWRMRGLQGHTAGGASASCRALQIGLLTEPLRASVGLEAGGWAGLPTCP